MNTTAEKLYFVFGVLCVAGILRPARGLLPEANPQFWSSRVVGIAKVRLSHLSLLSILCIYAGFAIVFAGAAFERNTCSFVGFGILTVSFACMAVSRERDIRRARRQQLPGWVS